MKRVLSAAVSALLVVALSVGAFASTYPLENEPMFYEQDGDTYIGTLVTSTLTNAQKDFLRAWLESDTNMLAYSRNSSLTHGQIVFYIFSSNTVLTSSSTSSDTAWATLQFASGAQFSSLNFDAVTGKQVGDGTYCNTSGTSRSVGSSNSIGVGTLISGTIFDKFSNVSLPSSALLDFEGRLYLEDDDGLLEGDEPPASSSEPETSEPAYEFPEVQPTDNQYIAYDVTVWNRAADVIKQSAGNSINISWLILALVMGWLLVSRIVKKLSK
ncbi:hypothetical protein [Marasmitruncus massiliensis]|uniref:hypothetical protein n=1 Tax=Marasmitruncus massiliensis TaxID=1944642 RepID=UPI000C7D1CB5|nr:hypothetical protein [Marasmitruncus massiliensis]